MSLSTRTLPPSDNDELSITAPLALSEARALQKSRLIDPDPSPKLPILAPVEEADQVVRVHGFGTAILVAAWLLVGAGLGGRLAGVVDTTAVDSVAIADFEPIEAWLDDNVGFNPDFGDDPAVPRQLAATDDPLRPDPVDEQVVSVDVDDSESGLRRDDDTTGTDQERSEAGDTAAGGTAAGGTAEGDVGPRSDFVQAWSQWLEADYSVEGQVTRERIDSDYQPLVIAFRAARRGNESLEQLGSSAVVGSAQGRRTCERGSQGTMLCTPPVAIANSDEIQAVATLVNGPEPTYAVTALGACPEDLCTDAAVAATPTLADVNCWETEATSIDEGQRWGRSSVFCFDPASNALIGRRTTSSNRVETFLATTVGTDVEDYQLEPR